MSVPGYTTQFKITQHIQAVLERLGITQLQKTVQSETDKNLDNSYLQVSWSLERTESPQFGDYASNVAMQLFRELTDEQKKEFRQPRVFAQKIVDALLSTESKKESSSSSVYEKIEVAGPGFINFFITPLQVWKDLAQIATQVSLVSYQDKALVSKSKLGYKKTTPLLSTHFTDKKILVEFTDPNPFKELHIGHAYSNTVGESIARLLEAAGAEVLRVCYQGDVGMHVAKSVWGMQTLLNESQQTPSDLEKLPLVDRIRFLGKAYALGATAYEEDKNAQKIIKEINFSTYAAAQQRLVKEEKWIPQVDYDAFLKDSNLNHQEISELYQFGRAWSLQYFDLMYAKLGMQFDDYFFESLVGEYGAEIVHAHLSQGVFKESDGAIIFPGSEHGLHDRVFINSLGLPTYEAKELGLAPEKYRRHSYDHSIIITGNEIKEYFKVLLKAMSITHPKLAQKTTHLSHGMVRLPDGKMSSRTGKVLTAEWLLDTAEQTILDRMQETRPEWSLQERTQAAQAISVGAVKYAFLKQGIGADIAFSFQESLSFTGQSGPYIQYMHVRCSSIITTILNSSESSSFQKDLASAGIHELWDAIVASDSDGSAQLQSKVDESSLVVAKVLVQYLMVLQKSSIEYAPHHVAVYAYELAQAFSVFYDQAPILKEQDTTKIAQRIAIVRATQLILQHALYVLGIAVVEKM